MKEKCLFILISLFLTTVSAQENIKYFSRFYVDPRQCQLRTEIPISFENSKLTYAYRVTYDEKNRIIDVRYLTRGYQNIDLSGFSGMIINYRDSIEKRRNVNNNNKPIKYSGVYANYLILNQEKHPSFIVVCLLAVTMFGVACSYVKVVAGLSLANMY